jgi:hypothetical protein
MGMFKSKRHALVEVPSERVSSTWPGDTLDEVDDASFAEAIEKGRAAEAARQVTVAA